MEDERQEELDSLLAIFPELVIDPDDPFTVSLELPTNLATSLLVRFIPPRPQSHTTYANKAENSVAYVEHDINVMHLPPMALKASLPKQYPSEAPPLVHLTTKWDWLPHEKLADLSRDAERLWEEYGRSQILYMYIDHLQQLAERGFDMDQSAEGCLVLPPNMELNIVEFDVSTKKAIFEAGTYDCGVCLERRKGSNCYQMDLCQHIFCQECLQAFYNNAIKEGDIAGIRCLDPDCGSGRAEGGHAERKRKKDVTLHPRELLAMGIEEPVVRRYLELRRKKKLEADKSTVYCPRTWCQGAAKSAKYPPIPTDLRAFVFSDKSAETADEDGAQPATEVRKNKQGKDPPPDPSDRLAVCEKCSLAFCRVCYMGWHGPFARCYPRDPNDLSAEEKASYEYIRMHTSPCAYCNAPVQKTMGCNHMCCFQCNTHFCYLCGAWLDPASPYKHFNTAGTPCYQRLWELEEGDEGQRPQDGHGFAGGRGWEQLAIEAARQADADEAEAAAVQAQTEEDQREAQAQMPPPAPDPPRAREVPLEVAMAQVRLDHPGQAPQLAPQQRRGGRRQRNPFPAHPPAQGVANAVRNHERAGNRRQPAVGPAANADAGWDDRRQAEIQRFLELAQRDEEDGWDSDELGDNDEGYIIR